jgi:hypothetical protein
MRRLATKTASVSICGTSDDGQYSRNELLDKTSANLTSIFNMLSPVICRYCVAVWREPKTYYRAVYADPAGVLFPVISRDSVTRRPTAMGRRHSRNAGQRSIV